MIYCPVCEPEKAGFIGWLSLKCIACRDCRHTWRDTSSKGNPVVGISRCACGAVYGGR